jgi:hypothetical protein
MAVAMVVVVAVAMAAAAAAVVVVVAEASVADKRTFLQRVHCKEPADAGSFFCVNCCRIKRCTLRRLGTLDACKPANALQSWLNLGPCCCASCMICPPLLHQRSGIR